MNSKRLKNKLHGMICLFFVGVGIAVILFLFISVWSM